MRTSITQIGPLAWSAALMDERYCYSTRGHSDMDAMDNLEGKLVERLNEIEAEADWIRKALAEKFPTTAA